MPYEVATPVFEGPFELLLHLVAREQVELYDISLATIIDGFVAEIERARALDLEVATEFLLIAATLVELKTRRLLPGRADAELDEELAIWEERDLLIARLLACLTFRAAAAALQSLASTAGRSYPRRAGIEDRFLNVVPDLLDGVTPERLRRAYVRAATPKPRLRIDLDHVAPLRISVRDAVDALLARLPDLGRATFRQLTGGLDQRLEVIVHFLAVLELYKMGLVEIDQGETFGTLFVEWTGGGAGAAAADRVLVGLSEA
ncbi:MAG: segregation and condensation protein A [Acidimicrobiales bacterium]